MLHGACSCAVIHLLQEQYVVVTDESLQRTSTGYNVLMQQLELVSLTRNAVLSS